MHKIDVLIPAAGKGTRSGLDYPKTLFKIKGKEILLYIFELVENINYKPTIIISPQGEKDINKFLLSHQRKAEIIIQKKAKGMGNAVLQYEKSLNFKNNNHLFYLYGVIFLL